MTSAPLQFFHVHTLTASEAAPLVVQRPASVATSQIVRVLADQAKSRWTLVETCEGQIPVNGALDDVIRTLRRAFPSCHLNTADGWQLLNLRAVASIFVSEEGHHDLGLVSGAVFRIPSPRELLDLVAGVASLATVTRGHSTYHIVREHVLGLSNSTVHLRGGHLVRHTEPDSTVEQRLSTP